MTQETNPKPIDLCDDIISGYMMGFCAAIDNKRASFKQEAELEKLLENSSQPVLAKYKVMKEQTTKFIESQSTEEVVLGGTGRGAFSLSQEDADWEEFMAIMRSLTAKNGSSVASADPKEEDRKLNDPYRKVMAAPGLKPTAEDVACSQDFGTITTAGIRTTQRSWIAYRYACAGFARALDPGSEDAVLAAVTANRERQLDLIFNPDGG